MRNIKSSYLLEHLLICTSYSCNERNEKVSTTISIGRTFVETGNGVYSFLTQVVRTCLLGLVSMKLSYLKIDILISPLLKKGIWEISSPRIFLSTCWYVLRTHAIRKKWKGFYDNLNWSDLRRNREWRLFILNQVVGTCWLDLVQSEVTNKDT
jgi:hypothetical protein